MRGNIRGSEAELKLFSAHKGDTAQSVFFRVFLCRGRLTSVAKIRRLRSQRRHKNVPQQDVRWRERWCVFLCLFVSKCRLAVGPSSNQARGRRELSCFSVS